MINGDIFMLCNSVTEKELSKFESADYRANIKEDGERILGVIIKNDVLLMNRRGKICNFHFPEIVEQLKKLPDCILDGEIVAYNNVFEDLQSRALTSNPNKIKELVKTIPCFYKVFDILRFQDEDLRDLPLKQRLRYIEINLNAFEFLSNVDLVEYNWVSVMLEKAKRINGEGIVIKEMCSKYESRRSDKWLKCKMFHEGELKVIKYAENPMGIRVEDENGIAVQVAGSQSREVKAKIDKEGSALINIQYLSKTKGNKYRFPSYRGLK